MGPTGQGTSSGRVAAVGKSRPVRQPHPCLASDEAAPCSRLAAYGCQPCLYYTHSKACALGSPPALGPMCVRLCVCVPHELRLHRPTPPSQSMSKAIKEFVTGKATMKANMKTYHYYENVSPGCLHPSSITRRGQGPWPCLGLPPQTNFCRQLLPCLGIWSSVPPINAPTQFCAHARC